MPVWINAGRSLRYREHQNRKHGSRPDRFWSLHYALHKKTHGEGVGWSSQGVTKEACLEILAELRLNWRTGAGPQTLKELRGAARKRKLAAESASLESGAPTMTLGRFWREAIWPQLLLASAKNRVSGYASWPRTWIKPLLERPLREIKTSDLEAHIVRPMLAAGRKPASIEAVLKIFSLVWRRAKALGLVQGDCPVSQVKRPRADNGRVRFLTPAEAVRLLSSLKSRSQDAHDFALLSLFTGLRAGECAALTWPDIDFENGLIFVKDAKNGQNRHAFITPEVRAMLLARKERWPSSTKVICGRRGGEATGGLIGIFRETVLRLGLNEGLTDARQIAVFHTLRHTYASWLVQKGQPLYTVSKLMGHRSISATERYAHLAPEIKRAAVGRLEGFLSAAS